MFIISNRANTYDPRKALKETFGYHLTFVKKGNSGMAM